MYMTLGGLFARAEMQYYLLNTHFFYHILLKLSGFSHDHSGCILTTSNINVTGRRVQGSIWGLNTGFWPASTQNIDGTARYSNAVP